MKSSALAKRAGTTPAYPIDAPGGDASRRTVERGGDAVARARPVDGGVRRNGEPLPAVGRTRRRTLPAAEGILSDPRIDRRLHAQYGFDASRFIRDAARIAAGELTASAALVTAPLAPVPETTRVVWSGAEAERMRRIGLSALKRGEVAVVVLNGGMATRFGGVVKGVVEVFGGKSFLELKAMDVRRTADEVGASIPFVLMNSFATQKATMAHVADRDGLGLGNNPLLTFEQTISLRLNPDGTLFIGDDGKPSYHAPGHGDFFASIKSSGVLDALARRGTKTILFSNVDNLGATLDPVIIGYHLASGRDMSAEVAEKRITAGGKWDVGASPVKIDGVTQLVEGFRLPKDLSPALFPHLSTNNFLFSLDALRRDIPMERYVVEKKVDGRPALQLESITCEASGARGPDGAPLLSLNVLLVPRDDARVGRFFPVKEPVDLEAMREVLRTRLART